MSESLDQILLNFDKGSLLLLNICIAFIMFGVALELKIEHFRLLLKSPKPVFIGMLSQLIMLPLATFGLVWLIQPSPSIALGMMLVASCPGGNVSNFYCALSKGNTALSVSLTAVSSSVSAFFTPISFALWATAYPPTADKLQAIDLNLPEMVMTVLIVLALPLIMGIIFSEKLPRLTSKISKPIKKLSILIFAGFVLIALFKNFDHFLNHIAEIIWIVLVHNALALLTGYSVASISGVSVADRRSITIETGIQNVSIALVIIFDFFDGLGGMAFIAAWWGIWHLLVGGGLSWFWSRRAV